MEKPTNTSGADGAHHENDYDDDVSHCSSQSSNSSLSSSSKGSLGSNSNSAGGSNLRRHKHPKKGPHELEHIDEEQGYDHYEMSSLLGDNRGAKPQQQKHPHNAKNKKAHRLNIHGDHSDDDSTLAVVGRDADDTKNLSKSDTRSKALLLKTAFWIACWYGTSLATLFLNKIILSRPGSSVHVLGMCQMTTAAVIGGWSAFGGLEYMKSSFSYMRRCLPGLGGRSSRGSAKGGERDEKLHNPVNSPDQVAESSSPSKTSKMGSHFVRDMSIVGVLRGLTVVLGLIALEHVPVSFVETIKATAPAFTVVFAKLILQERTATPVMFTLIPVVAGLILCSASELRFDTIGFVAAVMNNCADCVQNVMSKKMLVHLKPTQLQFYTSVAALCLQTPFVIKDVTVLFRKWAAHIPEDMQDVLADTVGAVENDERSLHDGLSLTKLLIIDAIFYHLQSVSAYCTMGCMSPVSQSVANTLKRALLVWASVLYFGNPVTNSGIVGVMMVVSGVFLYNHVRRIYQS